MPEEKCIPEGKTAKTLDEVKQMFYSWYQEHTQTFFLRSVPDQIDGYKLIIKRYIDPLINKTIQISKEKCKEDSSFRNKLETAVFEWECEVNQKCNGIQPIEQNGDPKRIDFHPKQHELEKLVEVNDENISIFNDMYQGGLPLIYNLPSFHIVTAKNRSTCSYANCLVELFLYIITELHKEKPFQNSNGGNSKKSSSKDIIKKTSHKWSRKYKKSINCKRPKGFSQRQYCKYGRKTRKH